MKKDKKPIIGNEPNDSKSGRLVGIIFLIWFFGSMFAMILFSKINTYYSVMVFGQYFLVFSILIFIGEKKNKIACVPFFLVGLACIIVPYLMMKPEINGMIVNWEGVIAVLIISGFILGGLAFIIIPTVKTKKLKQICTIEVGATIIDHDITYNDRKRLYCPIYEFDFNGKTYKVMNNQYTNVSVKPKGTIVNLKINPDNPEEFLDNGFTPIGCMIIGIGFLIISVPILIMILNNVSFIK